MTNNNFASTAELQARLEVLRAAHAATKEARKAEFDAAMARIAAIREARAARLAAVKAAAAAARKAAEAAEALLKAERDDLRHLKNELHKAEQRLWEKQHYFDEVEEDLVEDFVRRETPDRWENRHLPVGERRRKVYRSL